MIAKIVKSIPQDVDEHNPITLKEILNILPDVIPYKENIGINGRIRFGRQIGNISLTVQIDEQVPTEMSTYFHNLFMGATNGKKQVALDNSWRNRNNNPLWIYSEGEKTVKIIDDKIVYVKPIQPRDLPVWLPVEKIKEKIKTLRWKFPVDCYLTGGMVREGGSFNDVDFIIGTVGVDAEGNLIMTEVADREMCSNVRAVLQNHFGAEVGVNSLYLYGQLHVDVGSKIMTTKGQVYLCKVFEKNNLSYIGP